MAQALQKGALWDKTPLVFSYEISDKLGCNVYVKIETFQPSFNFKQRSVGTLIAQKVKEGSKNLHVVIPSSGNAAIAAAYAAFLQGIQCTVFIPALNGKKDILDTLKRLGADVRLHGEVFEDAYKAAVAFAGENPDNYTDPIAWEGASSIVDEIAAQIPEGIAIPDTIFCSVGGGSMLSGLLIGLERNKWTNTRIVAIETEGADCMYRSVMLNERPDYQLPSGTSTVFDEEYGVKAAVMVPTSKADSLGGYSPAPGVLKKVLELRKERPGSITCVKVSDEMAMRAVLQFADQHKVLQELAAGATLSPTVSRLLFERLCPAQEHAGGRKRTAVFIACGGYKITLKNMASYQDHLSQIDCRAEVVEIDGERFKLPDL